MLDKLLEAIFKSWGRVAFVFVVFDYEHCLVFRFGEYHHTAKPGLRVKIPLVDSLVRFKSNTDIIQSNNVTVTTTDKVTVTLSAAILLDYLMFDMGKISFLAIALNL